MTNVWSSLESKMSLWRDVAKRVTVEVWSDGDVTFEKDVPNWGFETVTVNIDELREIVETFDKWKAMNKEADTK